ncbi:hypothetical protein [Streptomyces sp. NPDC091268]|uniref:hypothetical protein n=1 Tax=Streptomyces sp. NPDC091268 TaxID=3365979 RepID=UPI0037FC51C0
MRAWTSATPAPTADESVRVKSRSTGTCLDDGGPAGLRALPCNEAESQKWG